MGGQMIFALAYLTLGLMVVLAARRAARRFFGAQTAFWLWLLPVFLMAASCVPAGALWPQRATPMIVSTVIAIDAGVRLVPNADFSLVMSFWLLGVTARLIHLARGHWRLNRRLKYVPPSMRKALLRDTGNATLPQLRLHPAGPALAPSLRGAILLLPDDFMQRFTADERALILQHELTHLRRGDALWNALAEIALALLWFHPLAWLARPRFRVDHELACDEAVLRRQPDAAGRYARTLLHSALPQSDADLAPGLLPWLEEPSLKERLMMINRQHVGTTRRYAGLLAIALLLGSGVALAQSHAPAAPASGASAATQDLSYNNKLPPHYPEVSTKQKEQGTVMLLVLVDPQGKPVAVKYEAAHSTTASASLISAATAAVMKWRFKPGMKNGKAVESYARVPMQFSLVETGTSTAAPSSTAARS